MAAQSHTHPKKFHSNGPNRLRNHREGSVPKKTKTQENRINERSLQTHPERPINIVFDMTNFLVDQSQPDVKTDFHKIMEYVVLPEVTKYFQSWMSVFDRPGIPKFPSNTCWGEVTIKPEYVETDPNRTDKFSEAIDGDLIIFLKSDNANNGILGYAGACKYHPESGRNNVGVLNLNGYYYGDLTPQTMDEFRSTVVHEVMHILGFSNNDFPWFNPDWPAGETNTNNTEKITVQVNDPNGSGTVASEFTILRTPESRNVARAHFGSSNIRGVYMEDQGGGGSAGSHFEKLHFGNEGMTAASTGDPLFSKFTFALFKDSGWYRVNADKAEAFYWGRGAGDHFYDNFDCDTVHDEFCSEYGAVGCSPDFHNLTQCTTTQFSNSCRINEARMHGSCVNDTGKQNLNSDVVGDNSRCFNVSVNNGSHYYGRCYTSECAVDGSGNPVINITIASGETQTCSSSGQQITFFAGNEVNEFIIKCPDIGEFCHAFNFCVDNCNGNGNCLDDGSCRCFNFWGGDRCNTPLSCNSDQEDICAMVNPHGTIGGGEG